MTSPIKKESYREIRSSGTYTEASFKSIEDLEKQLIEEHLGSGWVQDIDTKDELIFSTQIAGGNKWTRHYDRKTCTFICQRIYEINQALKAIDWPPVHFGD